MDPYDSGPHARRLSHALCSQVPTSCVPSVPSTAESRPNAHVRALTSLRTLGHFHLSVITDLAAVNSHAQVPVQEYISHILVFC